MSGRHRAQRLRVERLRLRGLQTITHQDLDRLGGGTVPLRAHGEPPSTYDTLRRNDITVIDATYLGGAAGCNGASSRPTTRRKEPSGRERSTRCPSFSSMGKKDTQK